MNDYISRQEVLDLIESAGTWGWSKAQLYEEIEKLTAADVRPVVYGEWIFDSEWWDYVCTNCKCRVGNSKGYDFCPHCGADMRKESN